MKFLVDNWALLVALVAILVMVGLTVYSFVKKPSTEQLQSVKEWLLFAVTEAEKKLGGGTGQLKLRFVYDMFVDKFPYVSDIISFEFFSDLVDEALEKMREMLKSNKAVSSYVTGKDDV